MSDDRLTAKESYLAMYAFLDLHHRRSGMDDLGVLLGGMSLLEDGSPADPSAWTAWEAAVIAARIRSVEADLHLEPIEGAPRLRPWHPLEGIPPKLTVEAVHDDWEGVRILLRPVDLTLPVLRIRFEEVVAFRNVNESYTCGIRRDLVPSSSPHCLQTMENSPFVRLTRQEAGGVLDDDVLIHHVIYTSEDCIDVVSRFPPVVEWLGSGPPRPFRS